MFDSTCSSVTLEQSFADTFHNQKRPSNSCFVDIMIVSGQQLRVQFYTRGMASTVSVRVTMRVAHFGQLLHFYIRRHVPLQKI